MTAALAGETDRSHNFANAAAILGVSERWLRLNSARLPRHKYGRTVRFTDSDLELIRAMHEQRPQLTPPTGDLFGNLSEIRPKSRPQRRQA